MSTTISTEEQIALALQRTVVLEQCPSFVIEVTGADRLDFLHRMSTNDLLAARHGQVVGTVFLTDKGRVVEYAYVVFLDQSLLLIVSRENKDTFLHWIERYVIMEDIQFRSVLGTQYCMLGPETHAVLSRSFDDPPVPGFFKMYKTGESQVIVSRRPDFDANWWDIISVEQEDHRISGIVATLPLMDHSAFETYRILGGMPAAEHELTQMYNPYETGLAHAVSLRKGCYIGQEVVARLDTYNKVQRTLVGIVLEKEANPSGGQLLLFVDDAEVGRVTSISATIFKEQRHGLAIVKKEVAKEGFVVRVGLEGHGILSSLPVEQVEVAFGQKTHPTGENRV